MKTWLFLGIVASLSFGISAIPLKYASNQKYLSGPLGVVIIGSSIGALFILMPYLIYKGELNVVSFYDNRFALFWSVCSGVVGAVGTIAVITALKSPYTEVSRLMAIVSTSVLVTAIMGMFLLKEVPIGQDRISVILGIALIIFGIKLVIH